MSKVNEVKDETLNNEVPVNDTPEKSEKQSIGYKIGAACGKVANGVTKTVKSKPFKIIATATAVIASAKAGYEYGKRKGSSVDTSDTGTGNIDAPTQE